MSYSILVVCVTCPFIFLMCATHNLTLPLIRNPFFPFEIYGEKLNAILKGFLFLLIHFGVCFNSFKEEKTINLIFKN